MDPARRASVPVEVERLQELLARRDELVRAIASGVAAEEWDRVMAAFDALLAAIARLEAGLPSGRPSGLDPGQTGE